MKKIAIFSFILISLYSFTQIKNTVPNVIEGTVLSDNTGKPVSNAHVYVVSGEEEAMTNNRGEFRIESWQKLPLILTVDHSEYEKMRLSISNPAGKHVVRIKPKS